MWMGKAELMFGKRVSVCSIVIRNADFSFPDVFDVSFASAPTQREDCVVVVRSRRYPRKLAVFFLLDFPTRFVVVSACLIQDGFLEVLVFRSQFISFRLEYVADFSERDGKVKETLQMFLYLSMGKAGPD